MVDVKLEENDIILRFSKDLISETTLNRLLEMLRFQELAKKNQMTEEQSWELSEEIKENWWQEHKMEFISRSENSENNN